MPNANSRRMRIIPSSFFDKKQSTYFCGILNLVANVSHALFATKISSASVSSVVNENVDLIVIFVGPNDVVGDSVEDLVGLTVGDLVGLFVGALVGPDVGDVFGVFVGDLLGLFVGDLVGIIVGDDDELFVGDVVGL